MIIREFQSCGRGLSAGLKQGHFDILPAVVHIAHEKLYLRLGPYWSLCVEEQYYMVWPLVTRGLRRRDSLLRLCIAGMVALLALRVALYFSLPVQWVRDDEMYYWTFTRPDALLAGSALTLWVRGPAGMGCLRTWKLAAGTSAAFGGLAAANWRWEPFHGSTFAEWMQMWGLTLVGVAACGVLALSLRAQWLTRSLSWKPRRPAIQFQKSPKTLFEEEPTGEHANFKRRQR